MTCTREDTYYKKKMDPRLLSHNGFTVCTELESRIGTVVVGRKSHPHLVRLLRVRDRYRTLGSFWTSIKNRLFLLCCFSTWTYSPDTNQFLSATGNHLLSWGKFGIHIQTFVKFKAVVPPTTKRGRRGCFFTLAFEPAGLEVLIVLLDPLD